MSSFFKPGLWRAAAFTAPSGITRTESINSGQMFWLPKTVLNMPFGYETKYHKEEPHLRTGATALRGGPYKSSTVLSISGALNYGVANGSEVQLDCDWDAAVFLNDMDAFLATSAALELFYFYDSGTSKYMKLKKCHRRSFNCDFGEAIFPRATWTLQLEVLEPNFYLTAPGA